MDFESKIDSEKLKILNQSIYERGHLDREHLMEFLKLVPTNDGNHIVTEVREWLRLLHDDSKFDKVSFPGDDINAVLSDLDSYGLVKSDTILRFKEEHGKTVPMS
jgi:hypothetical protein